MLGKVEICGVNTSQLKVLKNEETMDLLKRAQSGDAHARDTLIQGNLRLVLSVIQKFSQRGENADDLFQVGCIGLMKAIDHFNTDLDVRFSTYGVPMIVGEIRRYLRDNSPIRVSRSVRDTAYKVMLAREELMSGSQREPTVEEIAAKLKISREEVVEAMAKSIKNMEKLILGFIAYNVEVEDICLCKHCMKDFGGFKLFPERE